MKKSCSKFLNIVDEKHDINFHWPNYNRGSLSERGGLIERAPGLIRERGGRVIISWGHTRRGCHDREGPIR
jgi:hypothetical protein